jgi:hypothetical protein
LRAIGVAFSVADALGLAASFASELAALGVAEREDFLGGLPSGALFAAAGGEYPRNVLAHHPCGTQLANDSSKLGPHVSLVRRCTAASSHADGLARPASDENIDGWQVVGSALSGIGEDSWAMAWLAPSSVCAPVWAVLTAMTTCSEPSNQRPTTGFIDFDLPSDGESGSLECEVEAPDAGEK